MSNNQQDVDLTLFHPPSGRTDAISLSLSTTLADLASFAAALLGLDDATGTGGSNNVVLTKDSSKTALYHPRTAAADGLRTLGQSGIGNGAFISAYRLSEISAQEHPRTMAPAPTPRIPAPPAGGLDFSSLLATNASSTNTSGRSGASNANNTSGLSFNIPGLASAASATSPSRPIEWDKMNLDDAILRNPNPLHLMEILNNTSRHPNLLKELNYHNPTVYRKLMSAKGDIRAMANIWRETMMKSTTLRFLESHSKQSKEVEMRKRLAANPMDEEANKYFGEKIRQENVQRQYEQMMEEYPESMGRVLMLYINTLVNEKPLQVFVDSGAQTTIMSSACADRLGLLHLVDDRFAGTAVGVGTGKILGKIHLVDLTIGGYAFPCSITVMDSESGLGDKNMDCLFGLDMLKRHRCNIDLSKNALVFPISGGQTMEAPFLHEKDLPTSKGGTLDFDADRENAELEAEWEKRLKEQESKANDGGKRGDDKNGSNTMEEE